MYSNDEHIIKTIEDMKTETNVLNEQFIILSMNVDSTSYYEFRNMSFNERDGFITAINKKQQAMSGKDYM